MCVYVCVCVCVCVCLYFHLMGSLNKAEIQTATWICPIGMLCTPHHRDPNNHGYMCNWCLRDCLRQRTSSADTSRTRLHSLLQSLLNVRVFVCVCCVCVLCVRVGLCVCERTCATWMPLSERVRACMHKRILFCMLFPFLKGKSQSWVSTRAFTCQRWLVCLCQQCEHVSEHVCRFSVDLCLQSSCVCVCVCVCVRTPVEYLPARQSKQFSEKPNVARTLVSHATLFFT